jgi:type II secretory pathway component PulF
MPLYEYRARNRKGGLEVGNMNARDADAVGQELAKLGHFPVKIQEMGGAGRNKVKDEKDVPFSQRFEKVSAKDLVLFTRQMSTLFNAGLPILGILSALTEQMESPKLRRVLAQVQLDIQGGLAVSEAMSKHPDVFSQLYLSMIAAGEAGGVMDELLVRLADLLEKDEENRIKVKAAMSYPKMVVGAMSIAMIILMLKVVPIFVGMFEKAKIELPLATQIMIGANKAFQDYWHITGAVIFGLYMLHKKWVSTTSGRYKWDMFRLKFPLVGPILLRSAMSKFARVFGTLQKGGVPILEILNVTAQVMGNVVLTRVVVDVRESVQEGLGMAVPLKRSGLVPPLVVQMVAAGEESGSLDTMLIKVANYYDGEVDQAVKSLSSKIEPILLVFMGGMVLFLALAIFVPMWDMSKMAG